MLLCPAPPAMPRRFLTDQAKASLTDAVKAVEARSSAEVVVAVRARSGRYLLAPIILGVAAALAASAFLLFSDYEASLLAIWLEPFALGGLVGLLAARSPELQRWLTPRSILRRQVIAAARAAFFTRGVRHTTGRTGILLYISLTERVAELVGDRGVEDAVPRDAWDEAADRIRAAVARGADGAEVAGELRALGDLLEPILERSPDDVDELPDEVDVG